MLSGFLVDMPTMSHYIQGLERCRWLVDTRREVSRSSHWWLVDRIIRVGDVDFRYFGAP